MPDQQQKVSEASRETAIEITGDVMTAGQAPAHDIGLGAEGDRVARLIDQDKADLVAPCAELVDIVWSEFEGTDRCLMCGGPKPYGSCDAQHREHCAIGLARRALARHTPNGAQR